MTQPQLFDNSGRPANIPAYCRAEAREKSNKHGGIMKKVETEFETRVAGCTADHVADVLGVVLNSARRCVHYLAAEGTLHPIGIGMSRYLNPQTIYVHKNYADRYRAEIQAHAQKELEAGK